MSMPSQETKWYKDPGLIAYLDSLRKKNLEFMSKCYFCDEKSEGIEAIGYRLYPVCPNHPKPDINKLMESQTSFEE
jgi:hypothetical protein